MNDVIINKCNSILRCLKRIEEDFDEEFETNYTKQDAIVLNIQRAIQQAIDLGAYIVKNRKLGIPKTSKEIFKLLEKEGFIDKNLSENLQKMVGFRNLAIHEYTQLNIDILEYIVKERIWDLKEFVDEVKSFN